jgi:predicted NAD/FAD-dependent oxidoreductase
MASALPAVDQRPLTVHQPLVVDVAIIGAGIAGLLAARTLRDAGMNVVVLDKGRGVGGRLATRRVGEARFDHGAQFFTVRSTAFEERNEHWQREGVSRVWCHGFGASPDGHPRFVGAEGMTSLAKDLAAGVDVRSDHQVTAIVRTDDGWRIELAPVPATDVPATAVTAAAVISTAPVPQTLALLSAGHVQLMPAAAEALDRIRYSPVLAAMAVLDQPSAVPAPGGVQLNDGPFTWVGDNQAKGISVIPAVTLHSNPVVAEQLWNEPADVALAQLLAQGADWLGDGTVVDSSLHRWRYAQPTVLHPERHLMAVDGASPVACAGDAFGEARVEGAALSGWAAAEAILSRLR